MEYAKHIPKPKLPAKQEVHENQISQPPVPKSNKISGFQLISQSPAHGDQLHSGASSPSRNLDSTWAKRSSAMQSMNDYELSDLEELQQRHEDERMAVAEIQYKMQQTA